MYQKKGNLNPSSHLLLHKYTVSSLIFIFCVFGFLLGRKGRQYLFTLARVYHAEFMIVYVNDVLLVFFAPLKQGWCLLWNKGKALKDGLRCFVGGVGINSYPCCWNLFLFMRLQMMRRKIEENFSILKVIKVENFIRTSDYIFFHIFFNIFKCCFIVERREWKPQHKVND